MGPAISDSNNRLIILSVIQLNGGHCGSKNLPKKGQLVVIMKKQTKNDIPLKIKGKQLTS